LTEPSRTPGDGIASPPGPAPDVLPSAPEGPPGARIFSLEGRPAPALYLLGWLLTIVGAALLFIAVGAPPSTAASVMAALGLATLATGLASAAGYQLVARADRHPSLYRGPSPMLMLALVICAGSLVAGLASVVFALDATRPLPFLITLVISNVAFIVCIWLFVVRSGALSWHQMGWPVWRLEGTRARIGPVATAAATGALVMVPTMLAVSLLAGILGSILHVTAPDVLPDMTTSAETVFVALAAAVVAPIGEETFFRGFALTAWLRDLGPRAALLRSAVLFAVVHILNITSASFGEGLAQAVLELTAILPLGLVLGALFLRYGMAAAIAGHVTYNGLLLLIVLVAARSQGG
jgi:membrane protease YdiL (CAAX protease family)